MSEIKEVNIELGDEVSDMLYEASKYTHDIRPGFLTEHHASFSGLRTWPLNYFKDMDNVHQMMDSDGVGTKVEVSERLEDHRSIAFDLFAMACDDAVVRGGEPVALTSTLDTSNLEDPEYVHQVVSQLAHGYINAARAAGVVIVGGEFAELGDRVGGYGRFNYNWGATVLWAAHQERLLSGMGVLPGHKLVGLAEHGFRSNGLTDVRKIMHENHGDNWHHGIVKEVGELSLGELVQKPSIIYSRFMSELTGGFDINKEPRANVFANAHITGGGQPSKLKRMLQPSGYGVKIDRPISPPPVMEYVQKISGWSDEKAYGKWHMGPGFVIVTDEPEKVVLFAGQEGFAAQEIGEVIDESVIKIKNSGAQKHTEYLEYKVE